MTTGMGPFGCFSTGANGRITILVLTGITRLLATCNAVSRFAAACGWAFPDQCRARYAFLLPLHPHTIIDVRETSAKRISPSWHYCRKIDTLGQFLGREVELLVSPVNFGLRRRQISQQSTCSDSTPCQTSGISKAATAEGSVAPTP